MNQKVGSTSKKDLFDNDDVDDTSASSSAMSSEQKDDDRSSNKFSPSHESGAKFIVNKKFAKDYQDRKQREELRQITQQRRETGLASDDDEDHSSSDEEEDEDGRLLTNSMNLQFLQTIKALKNKDSAIYDPKSRFFDDKEEEKDDVGEKKPKPKKFKDVLRDQILEDMENEIDGQNGEGELDKARSIAKSKFAYDDHQEELRKAFLQETNVDDESDQEEDWMVMKRKAMSTKDDHAATEIQEGFKVLEELSKKKKGNDTFADPRGEVNDGEKFLIDFMKNKKWIDKEENSVHNMDEAIGEEVAEDDESSIEDLDRADEFEASYNFRFEQAAAETATSGAAHSIQTYARGQTMNTLRRQDATRKDKRQARKERKEAERKAKEEQLKRLKNAKRQEMEKKLSQVKAVIGAVDEEGIDEAAIMKMLQGDYDPEKFEKAMREAYGDDFYQQEDAEWKSDIDVRQALQNDEEGDVIIGRDDPDGDLYDNVDDADQEEEEAGDWEEEDENEEYVGGDEPEQSQFEKQIKSKLQEELYKLDYEDIVAGMPTRFKYRQVEPNDYGLTTHEILLARDSTLKQFVSLKKLAPYNEDEEHRIGSKKRRRFRELLKQDLLEEMGDEEPNQNEIDEQNDITEQEGQGKKKRRRLKKGKKISDQPSNENNKGLDVADSASKIESDDPDVEKPQKRRRKKGKKLESTVPASTKENSDPSHEETQANLNSKGESSVAMVEENNGKPEKAGRKKSKKQKKVIASLPKSRLASYGL